jgi:hypothetical protein
MSESPAAAGRDEVEVAHEALSETVCRVVGRNLTLAEWQRFVGEGVPYERTCPNLSSGVGAGPPDVGGTPIAEVAMDTAGRASA